MRACALVATLLICAAIMSCASASFMAHVEKRDPSNPSVLRQHSDTIHIKVAQPMDRAYALFRMNFASSGEHGGWSLSTIYNGAGWLLVRAIVFELDGERHEFRAQPDPVREYGKMGTAEATEQNIFTVSDAFMTALASAAEVSVWLQGDTDRVGRKLSARDRHNIAWYVGHVRANRDAPRPGQAEPYSK